MSKLFHLFRTQSLRGIFNLAFYRNFFLFFVKYKNLRSNLKDLLEGNNVTHIAYHDNDDTVYVRSGINKYFQHIFQLAN